MVLSSSRDYDYGIKVYIISNHRSARPESSILVYPGILGKHETTALCFLDRAGHRTHHFRLQSTFQLRWVPNVRKIPYFSRFSKCWKFCTAQNHDQNYVVSDSKSATVCPGRAQIRLARSECSQEKWDVANRELADRSQVRACWKPSVKSCPEVSAVVSWYAES